MVSLPHGYGIEYTDEGGVKRVDGPRINLLTDAAYRDPIAGTPYHKHVRVRLRPVEVGDEAALP